MWTWHLRSWLCTPTGQLKFYLLRETSRELQGNFHRAVHSRNHAATLTSATYAKLLTLSAMDLIQALPFASHCIALIWGRGVGPSLRPPGCEDVTADCGRHA